MDDIHKIWPHRWITPKAKPINSKIQGLGVIATEPISKGEAVAVLGGVIVPTKEIEKYSKIMGDVGIQIDDNFFIVPTSRKELEEKGVYNHSCNPNCGFKNSITLMAIKDIKPNEELVFDYAFCESVKQSFKCNCGSPNCRKVINPNDWKLPNLQKKYKEYFSPYIKSRINLL